MSLASKAGLVCSLLGATLVARGLALEGNIVWTVAAPLWCYHAYVAGDRDLCILNIVYFCIAVYGILYLT